MIGIDRARVWASFEELDTDLVILGIQKRFSNIKPRKLAGNTQAFKINEKNINEIRITENAGKVLIKIDFSYARFRSDSNFLPLSTESEKEIVENYLLKIIKEITLKKILRSDLHYDYLEICLQENIKKFHDYHNIISIFYRALKRKNYSKIGTCFKDFDYQNDFYYNTGFIFQINTGWKIRLYNKTCEHNKKYPNQIRGDNLRLEHRLSKTALDVYCKSSKVVDLKLQVIKQEILKKIGKKLFEYFKDELYRDIEILKTKFEGFDSRELSQLVRDYQEHILDEKIINQIITEKSQKSERQIKRYRQKIKEALKDYERNGHTKRSNFGNLERLEYFFNNFLYVDVMLKCDYENPLALSLP